MRFLTAAFIFVASSLAAEVPDRIMLEEPDRIWLRGTINVSSLAGHTLPFFSYVQFRDAVMTDHYLSSTPAILPVDCVNLFECPNPRYAGPIYTAPYEITADGVSFENITRSDLVFDRVEDQIILNLESFSKGAIEVPLSLEDGTLIRQMGSERVRYFPTTIEELHGIVGMAWILQIPVFENHACLIQGHITRQNVTPPDPADTALLALANLGSDIFRDEERRVMLSMNGTALILDLPQTVQSELEALNIKRGMLSWLMRDALDRLESGEPNPEGARLEDVIPENFLSKLSDEERRALYAKWRVAETAAPAYAQIRALADEGLALDTALCPNL